MTASTRVARNRRIGRLRGLSLVELLVGLAIGLAVVAGALQVVAVQARAQAAALLDARLVHDLQAAGERLHRSLRRAGAWADGPAPGVASPTSWSGEPGLAPGNPYAELVVSADGRELQLAASRDEIEDGLVGAHETIGLRLADGALQLRIGTGAWQALTDATRLRITRLQLDLLAASACGGAREVRHVRWVIEGETRAVRPVRRQVDGLTRVRNDRVDLRPCAPALPSTPAPTV